MALRTRSVGRARVLIRLSVLGVLCWALLIAGWWVTITDGRFVDTRALLALPAFAVAVAVVTVAWVGHNRAIYRRKGPRRAVPAGAHDWRFDRLGRIVLADEARLRDARIITVSVSGSFKSYEAAG